MDWHRSLKDLVTKDVRSSLYVSRFYLMKASIKYCNKVKWISGCYWNDVDGLVKIRYYGFQIITRPNFKSPASTLGEKLTEIPLQRIHHFSMNGPSINWNVFDSLNAEPIENEFPSLSNIGSCGLHPCSTSCLHDRFSMS